jgi:hypothetical protein
LVVWIFGFKLTEKILSGGGKGDLKKVPTVTGISHLRGGTFTPYVETTLSFILKINNIQIEAEARVTS